MVREFKLVNEKGQEYSLMDIYNYCLLTDPSGLGYSYTTEYEQLGNIFTTNLRKLNQEQHSGTLNFLNYDNYKNFADFIETSESLKFTYKIPYKNGVKEYFKDVQIQNLTKTEKKTNGIISETVTFDCLSLWYEEQNIEYKIEPMEDEIRWNFVWDGVFNDNNSTNMEFLNTGHTEAPIKVEINGPIVNPQIDLYVDGKLFQTVEITANIQEYEKLLYDSRENSFEITKIKADGTEEKLFKWGVINFENDNVIRLPKNKSCEIRLSSENTINNANLTIFPQYKIV